MERREGEKVGRNELEATEGWSGEGVMGGGSDRRRSRGVLRFGRAKRSVIGEREEVKSIKAKRTKQPLLGAQGLSGKARGKGKVTIQHVGFIEWKRNKTIKTKTNRILSDWGRKPGKTKRVGMLPSSYLDPLKVTLTMTMKITFSPFTTQHLAFISCSASPHRARTRTGRQQNKQSIANR
jgi:hypothetical protein